MLRVPNRTWYMDAHALALFFFVCVLVVVSFCAVFLCEIRHESKNKNKKRCFLQLAVVSSWLSLSKDAIEFCSIKEKERRGKKTRKRRVPLMSCDSQFEMHLFFFLITATVTQIS